MNAIVTFVAADYAAAELEGGDRSGESVTFSLSNWSGNTPPERQQMVKLDDVRMFTKGWRAASASPILAEKQKK